jgi:HlyD family secretion protein
MDTRISLDSYKNIKFTGRVSRIAAFVQDRDKQARTVDIEVEFTDPSQSQNLLPGYSADTEIIISVKNNILRIPTEAIFDINHVLLYDKDSSTLTLKEIELGVGNWTYSEVLSGLQENDYVLTSGKLKEFEDGVLVQVKNESPPSTQ